MNGVQSREVVAIARDHNVSYAEAKRIKAATDEVQAAKERLAPGGADGTEAGT